MDVRNSDSAVATLNAVLPEHYHVTALLDSDEVIIATTVYSSFRVEDDAPGEVVIPKCIAAIFSLQNRMYSEVTTLQEVSLL